MVLPDYCKEHLTVTKRKTALLLWIKYWTLYGSPFCVIIYWSYKLSKMVRFLWLKLLLFLVWYRFPEFTQRMLKYDVIQNIHFARDKELNILVYWTPSYGIIYRSYILSKMVRFFAHPVYAQRTTVGIWNRGSLLLWMASTYEGNTERRLTTLRIGAELAYRS